MSKQRLSNQQNQTTWIPNDASHTSPRTGVKHMRPPRGPWTSRFALPNFLKTTSWTSLRKQLTFSVRTTAETWPALHPAAWQHFISAYLGACLLPLAVAGLGERRLYYRKTLPIQEMPGNHRCAFIQSFV